MDRPTTEVIHDLPFTSCEKSYIIFTMGRTGSSWLTIGLYLLGLGVPMEYLNTTHREMLNKRGVGTANRRSRKELKEYIDELYQRRTTKNGVFGIKMHLGQWLESVSFDKSDHKGDKKFCTHFLETSFVNPYIIFLYRKDLLGQAISIYIARRSLSWSSDIPVKETVEYNYDGILKALKSVILDVERCKYIEKNIQIPKITFHYEDLEDDYSTVLQKIASFLSIPVDIPEGIQDRSIKKQRTKMTEVWKKRFMQEYQRNI